MDVVLQGLPKVIFYLDDILIKGSNDEEHLANIEQVLDRLRRYNIRAKKAKCSFLSPSIEYLGHRVDANGLHTTSSKVEAVSRALQPRNVLELRSLLGLVHYYGKFISNLSTLLHPLKLPPQGRPQVDVNTGMCNSFSSCKGSPSVSTHSDPSLPFKMAGDASVYRIGAVLSHCLSRWKGASCCICLQYIDTHRTKLLSN